MIALIERKIAIFLAKLVIDENYVPKAYFNQRVCFAYCITKSSWIKQQ